MHLFCLQRLDRALDGGDSAAVRELMELVARDVARARALARGMRSVQQRSAALRTRVDKLEAKLAAADEALERAAASDAARERQLAAVDTAAAEAAASDNR